MQSDPNEIIKTRLKNIENRIVRLAFLHSHLNKFKIDKTEIDESSRLIEGVSLFYYYSFSQFILEINKLFSSYSEDYYSLPNLLNHMESNIKFIEWYKQKTTYPETSSEQEESKGCVWTSGVRTEWQETAKDHDLTTAKLLINDLMKKIDDNQDELDKIKLARDKVIAHLDKDFQKYKINIQLETVEKLLILSSDIFNTLNFKINGSTTMLDHIKTDAISTIKPILKYYKLKGELIRAKRTPEKKFSAEELNEILK